MPLACVIRVLREPREPCARGRARASGALPLPTRGAPAPTTAYEHHEQHGFHGSPHAEARKPLRCFLHPCTRRTIAQASHALCGIHAINVRIVRKSCRGKADTPPRPWSIRSCTPTDLRAHISVPVSWPESPYPSLPCRGLLRLHTRLLKQAGTPRSSRARGLPQGFQSNEDGPTLVVMKQSDLNSVSSTGNRGFWRRREVCNVYSPPIRSTHSPSSVGCIFSVSTTNA